MALGARTATSNKPTVPTIWRMIFVTHLTRSFTARVFDELMYTVIIYDHVESLYIDG